MRLPLRNGETHPFSDRRDFQPLSFYRYALLLRPRGKVSLEGKLATANCCGTHAPRANGPIERRSYNQGDAFALFPAFIAVQPHPTGYVNGKVVAVLTRPSLCFLPAFHLYRVTIAFAQAESNEENPFEASATAISTRLDALFSSID